MDPPLAALTGRLICADTAQMVTALTLLPEHVEASRAEPGCLRFDLWQDDDPLIWHLSELFTGDDAFAAHQARMQSSDWGRGSAGFERDFTRSEALPRLRPERSDDAGGLDGLLEASFGREAEAALLRNLRQAGDLELSLVIEAGGAILGHAALSPLQGDVPAMALTPLAIHPKLRGRGLGTALVHAILAHATCPVVVLGNAGFYGRFGFGAADLVSDFSGPEMQVHGDLPSGLTIRHAPAFAGL